MSWMTEKKIICRNCGYGYTIVYCKNCDFGRAKCPKCSKSYLYIRDSITVTKIIEQTKAACSEMLFNLAKHVKTNSNRIIPDYFTLPISSEIGKLSNRIDEMVQDIETNDDHLEKGSDMEHCAAARHTSWWDGPRRHGNINRNPISWIQKERDYEWVMGLFPGGKGIEIGGHGMEERGLLGLSPVLTDTTYQLDGRTLDGIESDSIDYIVSTHVFEHIDQDPLKTLLRWSEVLKPGGIILIIMPDMAFFTHDPKVTEIYNSAPNEMYPWQMEDVIKKLNEKVSFELLSINTHKNNFDFETILRKRKTE